MRGALALCLAASVIGVASSFIDFCVACRLDLPLGPTDIGVAAGALILSTSLCACRDWLRIRSATLSGR